ncbi:hypothetical protein [Bacillus cereus]|uniref:hypothetical protein n=1 Tax=Bacillus cereus TaxID=1396 RepID=UPI000BF32372|nr:hypothetical protein [Bacillus cereus]PEY62891.1 hypothetical protein CN356_17785 [Bacillus cereus]PFT27797.1 hypothetical protein COK61_22330 [Bacillus cereus]PFW02680.1 hypothetical protein COL12_29640 [Bacillus cereus]
MRKEVIRIFEEANRVFLQNQKNFILSGVSERALCGELMKYLNIEKDKTEFSTYHVDVEYNRNEGGKIKTIKNDKEKIINITCDIIVHSRGESKEQDNLIAIEMKKSTNTKIEKDKDKERLIALTKDTFDNIWSYDGETFPEHVCRYMLGVYYEINLKERIVEIEYYVKGAFKKGYSLEF